MADPIDERALVTDALRSALRAAEGYLADIDGATVRARDADAVAERFSVPLPDHGFGTLAALEQLVAGSDGIVRASGPRFFGFVQGGGTPAALAADVLASVWDQNAGLWAGSPLASRLEAVSIEWLKDLFGLPKDWGGVLTTGATMANFVGLAAARRWWGERHGVNVEEAGLAGLPPVPILTGGYIHVSAVKAVAMLGLGRANIRRFTPDAVGRLDADALEDALRALGGAPAIIIGNAGEVNAGDFDPIARLADLAERHGAWLHVDGAFGLFARLTPRASALAEGVERAHSVIADGHKWLNVPYDSGFAFVRDAWRLEGSFGATAPYLGDPDEARPDFAHRGPEMSRRARGIAVWTTLAAYGRDGHRAMVERHLALAQRLARRIDAAPELERLADAPLNIVCFRYRPASAHPDGLDALNERLGRAVLADGRVFVGTTRYGGRVAFRPAIVNWRTTEHDVDLIVEVVRELGARLVEVAGTSSV